MVEISEGTNEVAVFPFSKGRSSWAGPSCAGSDAGAQGPEEGSAGASQAAPRKDLLARKARILVEFLLEKYTKKEPITQNALMKIVSRKYRQHFPEIFSTARERVELVFGLEMKEIDRRGNIYTPFLLTYVVPSLVSSNSCLWSS